MGNSRCDLNPARLLSRLIPQSYVKCVKMKSVGPKSGVDVNYVVVVVVDSLSGRLIQAVVEAQCCAPSYCR